MRRSLLQGLPVESVPVLAEGAFQKKEDLLKLLGDSRFISENHMQSLAEISESLGLDVTRQLRETDNSRTMEGLYIKVEENGQVTDRMKFVRASFLQTVAVSQTHWLDRPIVPNGLAVAVEDLFSPEGKGEAE